jgi:hypothetical protein
MIACGYLAGMLGNNENVAVLDSMAFATFCGDTVLGWP